MKQRWHFIIPIVAIFLVVIYFPSPRLIAEDLAPGETPPAEVIDATEVVTTPLGAPSLASEEETIDTEQAATEPSLSTTEASKGNVIVTAVRTMDVTGNAKKVFTGGEFIRYAGTIKNTTGKAATAYFVWSYVGPCGTTTLWAGNLETGVGTWHWTLDSTTPTGCPGTYQYTLSVTYNKNSAKSVNFTVTNNANCPIIKKWKGEYWSNPNLSGNRVFCRNDSAINFDWATGSPNGSIPSDGFSARWTRTLNFKSGLYRFYLRGDDGIRLWVGNHLLIDQWHDQDETEYIADWNLKSGNHTLRVEYYENGGDASVALWWELVNENAENIALGRPAYATSYYWDGLEPSRANDGDVNTRWSSAANEGLDWWWTDIGTQTFERIVIKWETAYAGQYFLGWSDDGVNYTGNWYTLTDERTVIHNVGTHTARYVGVMMSEYAPCCTNYSFWEFQVWQNVTTASVDPAASETDAITIMPDGDLVTVQLTQSSVENRLYLPLIAR